MYMSKNTTDIIKDWWANVPFDTMEKITGFRRIDFNSADGYQEFVNACDKWWNWLDLDSKVFYYQMYN